MFVSNLLQETRIDALKSIFAKYGEVVDVYVATKKDVNKKSFAFVRFKKMQDERKFEETLQGIAFKGRKLEVNTWYSMEHFGCMKHVTKEHII